MATLTAAAAARRLASLGKVTGLRERWRELRDLRRATTAASSAASSATSAAAAAAAASAAARHCRAAEWQVVYGGRLDADGDPAHLVTVRGRADAAHDGREVGRPRTRAPLARSAASGRLGAAHL
eukprot:scaffold259_cov38-Phaeocystis_antarctica.AAC.1